MTEDGYESDNSELYLIIWRRKIDWSFARRRKYRCSGRVLHIISSIVLLVGNCEDGVMASISRDDDDDDDDGDEEMCEIIAGRLLEQKCYLEFL